MPTVEPGVGLPVSGRIYRAWLIAWFPRRFPRGALSEAAALYVETLRDERRRGRLRALGYSLRTFVAAVRDGIAERSSPGPGRSGLILGVPSDLRLGARRLLRSPGYAAVALLSLCVGIGMNVILFSAVNALLWTPLEVPRPDQLVRIFSPDARETLASTLNLQEVEALDAGSPSLLGVAGASRFSAAAELAGFAQVVDGELVTANYLSVLDLVPWAGSGFRPEHELVSGERVGLLSHGFASGISGSPRSLVGETLRLNQEPVTVIGILPAGFGGLNFANHADVWLTFASQSILGMEVKGDPAARTLSGIARLRPGATLAEANRDVRSVVRTLGSGGPGDDRSAEYFVLPERAGLINPDMPHLVTVSGAVALLGCLLILLVACANVAALALARSVGLAKELGVRTALGASRGRLLRQLLSEGAVLVIPAAVLGLAPVLVAGPIYSFLLPALAETDVAFALDARVVAWVVGSAVLALLMAGAIPGLYATGRATSGIVGGTRGGASRGLNRLLRTLVVGEVTLAVVALVLGAVFTQTARWYTTVDSGIATEGRLAISVDAGFHGLDEDDGRQVLSELARRTAASQTAERAALAAGVGSTGTISVLDETNAPKPFASSVIGPGYFDVLEIPVLAGREFGDEDGDGPPVVVVNQPFADVRWPGAEVVGRSIQVGEAGEVAMVVGVVAATGTTSPLHRPQPVVYLPFSQHYRQRMILIVESPLASDAVVTGVRANLQALRPGLPIGRVIRVDDIVNGDRRFALAAATVGLSIGLAALFLAAVGIFGMLAFTVAQQRGELGVRLALGATPSRLFYRVLKRGIGLGVLGAALGLPPAVALGLGIRGLALGSRPLDPAMLGAVTLVILLVVTVAVAVPAARAAGLSPSEALAER